MLLRGKNSDCLPWDMKSISRSSEVDNFHIFRSCEQVFVAAGDRVPQPSLNDESSGKIEDSPSLSPIIINNLYMKNSNLT